MHVLLKAQHATFPASKKDIKAVCMAHPASFGWTPRWERPPGSDFDPVYQLRGVFGYP